MKLCHIPILALALLLPCLAARAQRVSVAFYNLENFYDTIPAADHDDRDYLPAGRLRWTGERYRSKTANIARVVDAMAPDLLGLCEIEGEAAVRDLVGALETDYNYIHRPTRDGRGMDVALLYKGDRFVPDRVRQVGSRSGRAFLYVRGELLGERIDIVVVHLLSRLNPHGRRLATMRALYEFVSELYGSDPHSRIVIMGDMNAAPGDAIMRRTFGTGGGDGLLSTPFARMAAEGAGSYAYNDRWLLYDNILLDRRIMRPSGPVGFSYVDCGIFIRPWLLTGGSGTRRGYPLRTFTGTRWNNGFSDHLPVFVYLELRVDSY